ncbi:MAG: universal stress protein [Pirellulaceae bacterium]|nr:universal stress protein [Planctomycetales bacterium]
MIKRILVDLCGTQFTSSVVRHAVQLARFHAAELTAVSIVDMERLTRVGAVPVGTQQVLRDLCERRVEVTHHHIDAAVDEFTTACETAGVAYRVQREEGEPFGTMQQYVRYHDLLICGLRSLFEHEVVEEPPDELVRLVSSGVRPILAVARDYGQVKRALIAYSGSVESASTLKQFVQCNPWPDAIIGLVHFARSRSKGESLLADAVHYCRAHGVVAEPEVMTEPAAGRLLAFAHDWKADLLVVGNSARNLILRRVFGEVALETIRTATLPLFLAQ